MCVHRESTVKIEKKNAKQKWRENALRMFAANEKVFKLFFLTILF